MSLTDRELKLMREIEHRLAVEDPSFARRMTGQLSRTTLRRTTLRRTTLSRTTVGGSAFPYRRPGRSRVSTWLVAGVVAYMILSFLLVLAVAGAISSGAFFFCLAADVFGLAAVVAAARLPGRAGRLRTVRASAQPPAGRIRHRRRGSC